MAMEWRMTPVRQYVSAFTHRQPPDWQIGAILATTAHGDKVGYIAHFDLPFLRESERTRGTSALDGYTYVLVVLEDVTGYMWQAPANACTTE